MKGGVIIDEKLAKRLYERFPKLYQSRNRPPSESLMSFGFMVSGNGWFPLIWRLSEQLEKCSPDTVAFEVKEKLARLRFYVDHATAAGFEAINAAEDESATICEECGKPGEVREHDKWLYTRCEKCWKKLLADKNL